MWTSVVNHVCAFAVHGRNGKEKSVLVVPGLLEAWRLICVNLLKFWLVGAVGGQWWHRHRMPIRSSILPVGKWLGWMPKAASVKPCWVWLPSSHKLKTSRLEMWKLSCEFAIMDRVRKAHLMRLFGRASHRYAQSTTPVTPHTTHHTPPFVTLHSTCKDTYHLHYHRHHHHHDCTSDCVWHVGRDE